MYEDYALKEYLFHWQSQNSASPELPMNIEWRLAEPIARGEASPDSDIDVMLVSKSFDNSDEEANIKAWSFTRRVDTRIEPYTVGLHQFLNDEVSPLLQIVNQDGIEIELY